MIANRELTMDDYLAMLRRRAKWILIPALLAPLAGWLISYAFPAKYTSQALCWWKARRCRRACATVVTADLTGRIATLQQQVLSQSRLQPMLERVYGKSSQNLDELVDNIRLNMTVEPVVTDLAQFGTSGKKKPGQSSAVPGFYITTLPQARASSADLQRTDFATARGEPQIARGRGAGNDQLSQQGTGGC